MATLDQVIAQIRFQLEQLSSRNAHHEFEHLCRHLARARICSNILPATGPVSAGGDQGRDFESFRTHLQARLPHGSGFVGLASDQPIAFACTLTQDKRINSKIKADLKSITSSGNPVAEVHFFCTVDVPAAQRHDLQAWARGTYDLHLEIYDGQALSEMLAGRDVFWIAERFLSIPAEMYPPPPEGSGARWYDELLQAWRAREDSPANYADFSELKSAIRHATFKDKIKQDIPLWLELLEELRQATRLSELRRQCTYEIAVARLRGQGSLHGFEDDLREYFADVPSLTDPPELEDAAALLTYCTRATANGSVDLLRDEVQTWREAVTARVEQELGKAKGPGRKCALLQTRAFLHTTPALDSLEPNLSAAVRCWKKLLTLVHEAPLFPLERLANYFTLMIELGFEHPDLDVLAQKVDQLLAKQQGGFVVAEKSQARAIAYYKRGDILKAMNQLHKAKLNWFSGDTLQGSLLACLSLSKLYGELGLFFAAKHYAFIVAYVAYHASNESVKPFIPEALVEAAEFDYRQGAWCHYMVLSEVGLLTFSVFSREQDPTEANEINRSLYHTSVIRVVTALLGSKHTAYINQSVERWGLAEHFEEFQRMMEDKWQNSALEEIKEAFQEQGVGIPWSDARPIREAAFAALGIVWTFKWTNTYEANLAAESFLAAFQVVLAALGGVDLCLLRTTAEIRLEFVERWDIQFDPVPSNDQIMWLLRLPSSETVPGGGAALTTREQITIAAVTSILEQASVYSTEAFWVVVDETLRGGIFDKAFFGARYEMAYRKFVEREMLETYIQKYPPFLPSSFILPQPHPQLEWFGGPSPFYSPAQTQEVIKRRYKGALESVRYTLPSLLKSADFQEVIRKLKAEGWLDWHLLMAIANVAVNYRTDIRVSLLSEHPTEEQYRTIGFQVLNEQESITSLPVPKSMFTEESLRILLQSSLVSTLLGLGHEVHLLTPDFDAISDFLGERYHYWTDDVEHADLGFDL